MNRLSILLLVVATAVSAVIAQSPHPEVTVSDGIAYRFENPKFLINHIDLRLDANGSGILKFARQGIAEPVERPVRVAPETGVRLAATLDRLGFLGSSEVYQTKDDHSNLGETTVIERRNGASREARFNYTANKDMADVASTLRGIANREILAFDLENAARFQPLDTPKLLDAISSELSLGRITDPSLIVPLLQEIADQPGMPLIAQNKARRLVAKIAGGK